MSGIIGSRFNTRGSGLVGSLGTDGQVFTSSGAGTGAVFEATAGGGKLLQAVTATDSTARNSTGTSFAVNSNTLQVAITPSSTDSDVYVVCSYSGYNGSDTWSTTIYRDTTNLGDATYGMVFSEQTFSGASTLSVLDSPSSTSELVYGFQFRSVGAGNTFGCCRSGCKNHITAFEIDGS
jgi:hypothetical protein